MTWSRALAVAAVWIGGTFTPTAAREGAPAPADKPVSDRPGDPETGYRLLRTKPFLPPDLTHELFRELWTVWPDERRAAAEKLPPAEREAMLRSYYGLIPAADGFGKTPLGYVDTPRGWVMSCLACHGGKVLGKTYPGLPNSHYGLQTLTEDVALLKLQKGVALGHMELGAVAIPLGGTFGTTNAVVFGVALGAKRDEHLNVDRSRPTPPLIHHDLDAPPFWNVKKKSFLYYDAFVRKSRRSLMQFMMLPTNDGPTFRGWEDDFRHILAWIEAVEPPKYPFPIDRPLADRGRLVFEKHCAECHGTYGKDWTYPNRVVDIGEIGTDRVRFDSLNREYRLAFGRSWLGNYDTANVKAETVGYIAPPLDGIWASAPYFHNGSVPTLRQVLAPSERPVVWSRTEDGYDRTRVGLEIASAPEVPPLADDAARRRWFDTRKRSKGRQGHDYAEPLSEPEKSALLEYLKTL